MKIILCFMLMFMLCGCQSDDNVNTGIFLLEENDINDSYDMTGDDLTDNITYVNNSTEEGIYTGIEITINDETITLETMDPCYDIAIYVIQLSDNCFLWVNGTGDNGDDPFQCLYQYQNNKLVNVLQFDELILPYSFHITTNITDVKDNEIIICQSCMSASLGRIVYNDTYIYENNTFMRKSTTVPISSITYSDESEYGTIKNDIIAYKDSSLSQELDTIKAGTIANPTSINFDENHLSIEITTNNDNTYWVEGSSEFDDENLIFEECYLAG